jgi:hypothetical protein
MLGVKGQSPDDSQKNFRAIVLESNGYHEAFEKMTYAQALELNKELETIMARDNYNLDNPVTCYNKAFESYRNYVLKDRHFI